MDADRSWEWRDDASLNEVRDNGGSFKICVDGGWRSRTSGAMAFTVHAANLDADGMVRFTPVWLLTHTIRCATSAFQTEAAALELALSCFIHFVE